MKKLRALIVTDSPDRKNFLEYHIKTQDLRPIYYPNIMSARMAVKSDPFSLVIVDLSIPVEPKLALIKECLESQPDTMVISIGKIEFLNSQKLLPKVPNVVSLESIESVPVLLEKWHQKEME